MDFHTVMKMAAMTFLPFMFVVVLFILIGLCLIPDNKGDKPKAADSKEAKARERYVNSPAP